MIPSLLLSIVLVAGSPSSIRRPSADAPTPPPPGARGSEAAAKEPSADATLEFGRFGRVYLYGDPAKARAVVLFASGDGGWQLGVVDMARELAKLDALVVGIDVVRYLKAVDSGAEKCAYPAAEFEELAQFVEKKLGFPAYLPPILVGYSSGATLVYAIQVQAPPATFLGSISLGFCPDLWTVKPFCRGHGLEFAPNPKERGVLFSPASTLETPWWVFQGSIDQVCDPPSTAAYVASVPRGELVALPKVGHGFSVPRNWLPQFKAAFARFTANVATRPPEPEPSPADAAGAPAVSDLPLVEVAARTSAPGGPAATTLAVILSGDGGWAGLDKEIAGELAGLGMPTVGWNSLQYYWHARTPEEAAGDLARILAHYLPTWGKQRVLLVGYSFGADVLPFLVARLPAAWRERVDLVALIAPSTSAQFEFHVAEWLGATARDSRPTAPEMERLQGLRVLCLQGDDDAEGLCRDLPSTIAETEILAGGHHFGGGFAAVAKRIVDALPRAAIETKPTP